jgi:glyoxylase-like metal-dependent hydrolase (beta-lactamase superfamily II)
MDEVGVVAAREVGSAYGFVKQYVARDEQPCFGAVKSDVAGRVAGDVQDLDNHADLIHNIRTKLFALPEDTRVIAGHGRMTDIGHEVQIPCKFYANFLKRSSETLIRVSDDLSLSGFKKTDCAVFHARCRSFCRKRFRRPF